MFTLLDKSKVFDSFCCPEVDDMEECLDEDDEDDEDPNEYETDTIIETQIKEVCTDDPSEVSKDVKLLSDNGLIDTTVKERLQKHQSCLFKRAASSTVSMFSCIEGDAKSKPNCEKYSPYLQVEFGGKTVYTFAKPLQFGYSKRGNAYLPTVYFEFGASSRTHLLHLLPSALLF